MTRIRLDYQEFREITRDLGALFGVDVTELSSGTRFGRIVYLQMREEKALHRFIYFRLMFESRTGVIFYTGRRLGIETDPDRECRQGRANAVLGDASDGCEAGMDVLDKLDQWLHIHQVDVH